MNRPTEVGAPKEPASADVACRSIFRRLLEVIESRQVERPSGSYVVRLLDEGHQAIGGKIIEEAREVAVAAAEKTVTDQGPLIHEIADLIFHTLVMAGWAGISLNQIEAELAGRFGTGGLREKAARGQGTP